MSQHPTLLLFPIQSFVEWGGGRRERKSVCRVSLETWEFHKTCSYTGTYNILVENTFLINTGMFRNLKQNLLLCLIKMTLETLFPTLFFFVYRMSTYFSPFAPVLLLRPSPSPFFPRLLFFCPSTHSPFPPSGKKKFHQHLLLENKFTFFHTIYRGKESGNKNCYLANFIPRYSLCVGTRKR